MKVCDEYCEVMCRSCVNYDYRERKCNLSGDVVSKKHYCDDFECELIGLSFADIKELVKNRLEDGYSKYDE